MPNVNSHGVREPTVQVSVGDDGARSTTVTTHTTENTEDGYEVTTETATTSTTRTISLRKAPTREITLSEDHKFSRTVLDCGMYPHLFDMIVNCAPPEALLKLRGPSKDVKEQVDKILSRHVVLDEGGNLRTRYGYIWFDEATHNSTTL